MITPQSVIILYVCIGIANFLIFCTSWVYDKIGKPDKKQHLIFSFVFAGMLWLVFYPSLIGVGLGTYISYIYNKNFGLLDKLADFMIGD